MKKSLFPVLLIGLAVPCFSQNIFTADSGRAWNDNWLYIGGRLGGSVHFYQLGDYDIKNHGSFDFAVQMSVPLLKNFGIQAELMYSTEEVVFLWEGDIRVSSSAYPGIYSIYPGTEEIRAKFSEFMIPVLLKYNYEFGLFNVAGLFGPFFTIPTGKMEYAGTLTYSVYSDQFESTYEVEDIFGLMAGLNFGVKLGPGTLFLDVRYAIDNDMLKIDGERFAHRNFLPLSIGYELGLLPKKK
jgi:hypothetical protein